MKNDWRIVEAVLSAMPNAIDLDAAISTLEESACTYHTSARAAGGASMEKLSLLLPPVQIRSFLPAH